MTPDDREAVRAQLVEHEGLRLSAYQDHLGYWTIGVGRLIDARRGGGITRDEAMVLLDGDIEACLIDLETFPWFAGLNPVQQRAVIDMRFQLGAAGLRKFRKMLAALEAGDPVDAARLALMSKWAREDTPTRARVVTEMLRTGRV